MSCRDCELLLAQGETNVELERHLEACEECRGLAGELRENALALSELKNEELPQLVVRIPRRFPVYALAGAAAAAAFVAGMLLPRSPMPEPVRPAVAVTPEPHPVAAEPAAPPARHRTAKVEPLKIKMLTSDPDVVIYWLIEN